MIEATRRVLGGRYRLDLLLASGGMGQVWRARDTLLDRAVAVKVLRSEYSGDPTFLSRFRTEAQLTAGLVHRNIATLFDYGETVAPDDGGETLAYLVMELVEGESLSAVLAREGRLESARTLDLLRQTAAALAAAHAAGVVHRDVKPGNVLVGDDGVVRITDFGIAWSASSVPLTRTGQVVGTPHYLPPEQAAGERACPAGDVYALGLIGYECLAGRRAFDGDNAIQIALRQLRDEPDPLPPDVPEAVRTLIGRALLKDPAERFADGAAFRDAIADVQAGRPLPPLAAGPDTMPFAVPGASSAAAPVPPRRSRVLVPLAALAAGAAIAVAGLQLIAPAAGPPAAVVGAETDTDIVLVAADYVGRPVDEVEAALGALGLTVERRAEPTSAVAAGTVTAISPSGAVRPGDLVTVAYAVAPTVDPAPAPGAVQQVSAPVVSVPADDGGAAAGPEQPAGGNGNANGRGSGGTNGKGNGKAGQGAVSGTGNGNGAGHGRDNGKGRSNGNGRGNG